MHKVFSEYSILIQMPRHLELLLRSDYHVDRAFRHEEHLTCAHAQHLQARQMRKHDWPACSLVRFMKRSASGSIAFSVIVRVRRGLLAATLQERYCVLVYTAK